MDRWRRVCLDAGLVRSSLARRFIIMLVARLLVSSLRTPLPDLDTAAPASFEDFYLHTGAQSRWSAAKNKKWPKTDAASGRNILACSVFLAECALDLPISGLSPLAHPD